MVRAGAMAQGSTGASASGSGDGAAPSGNTAPSGTAACVHDELAAALDAVYARAYKELLDSLQDPPPAFAQYRPEGATVEPDVIELE